MESNNKKEIKIVCTIGPATESEEKIKGLADAGMSIARCNFSHGSHEEHGRKFALVREVNKKYGKEILNSLSRIFSFRSNYFDFFQMNLKQSYISRCDTIDTSCLTESRRTDFFQFLTGFVA